MQTTQTLNTTSTTECLISFFTYRVQVVGYGRLDIVPCSRLFTGTLKV